MGTGPADSNGLREDALRVRARRGTLSRRGVLALLGGLGVAGGLAACGQGTTAGSPIAGSSGGSVAAPTGATTPTPGASTAATAATGASGPLTEIPDETEGPFPADGSNGPNVLDDSGIVRRDIRGSVGGGAVAAGVPLTTTIVVRDAATGDALPGAAVYAWHCDRDGDYSIYSAGLEDEDYLRGVQVTDETGAVTFTSIFPGCYPGRWPHVHFEVYRDVAAATGDGVPVKTSQLAFPREVCEAAYTTDGYATSAANLGGVSLASDGVFGEDRGIHQLATMTGDASSGYTATLLAPV